jgi:hypothetical protein
MDMMSDAAIGTINDEQQAPATQLAAHAAAGARLVDAIRSDDAFSALCAELGALCDFQNFIVYVFREDASPSLIATNRGVPRMQDSMADYIRGGTRSTRSTGSPLNVPRVFIGCATSCRRLFRSPNSIAASTSSPTSPTS